MTKTAKTEVIIVGSGVAGGTIARELSSAGRKVLVLERGPKIKKITAKALLVEKGPDEKTLSTLPNRLDVLYDGQGLLLTPEKVYIYRSLLVGGTSIVTAGNAVRAGQKEFKEVGIDLEEDFQEAERNLSVTPAPEKVIGEGARKIIKAADELGYQMKPMPKCINFDRCRGCGLCLFGCPTKAKWTSLTFLDEAIENGARLLSDISVEEVIIQGGQAVGVKAHGLNGDIEFYGDVIILAAGAVGTPIILQASGIEDAGRNFFVDLCRNTCGVVDSTGLTREHPMPVFCDDMYEEGGFLIAPISYPDPMLYVVDYDNKYYKSLNLYNMMRIGYKMMSLKKNRVIGIMIKVRDEPSGIIHKDGSISKGVTKKDMEKLDAGAELARKILIQAGADSKTIFNGKIMGGHLGGTAAVGSIVDLNFETKKIKNLFVCDASIFPTSPGAPPLLTIVAFSKYFSKKMMANA